MRRLWIHGFFATMSVVLLTLGLWQGYQQYQTQQTLSAIAVVASHPDGKSKNPHVVLASANALSTDGQFEAAERLFVSLIDQQQSTPLGQAARFNLANHYLRQGLRKDLPPGQTRPLLEIAKQRYRDLLHIDPQDWDARYNLELALHVAPEIIKVKQPKGPPTQRARVIVPDVDVGDLP